MDDFVLQFGFERHSYTTQVDNYDHFSIMWDTYKRINTILIITVLDFRRVS